jgi:hypothetical protein
MKEKELTPLELNGKIKISLWYILGLKGCGRDLLYLVQSWDLEKPTVELKNLIKQHMVNMVGVTNMEIKDRENRLISEINQLRTFVELYYPLVKE